MSRVPKPRRAGFLNRRSLRLLPHQVQPLGGARAVQLPVHPDCPTAVRQRAVLHRVRRQFLQRHRKGQGHARRYLHGRTLHVDAVFSATAVRLDGLRDDVVKATAAQLRSVRTSWTCDRAMRRLSMALEAWSRSGALRRVCEAMDCTVASVFFTRWLSSSMRRSLSYGSPQLVHNTQPLNGCPEEIGVAPQELDVRLREVPWLSAIDLKDTEGRASVAAQDQHVHESLHAMFFHEVMVLKPLLRRDVVRDDRPILEGQPLWRVFGGSDGHVPNDARLPSDAGANLQGLPSGRSSIIFARSVLSARPTSSQALSEYRQGPPS